MAHKSIKAVLCIAALAAQASASVTVRKTNQGPTGYEVDFTYVNASAQSVGLYGLDFYSNQFHTTPQKSASIDPRDWQPGDFIAAVYPFPDPLAMTASGNGSWTFTTPLPSGSFRYNFNVDGQADVIDIDNPPFVNVPGDQVLSTFQVPYDANFQFRDDMYLNFDFALPAAEGARGTVKPVNYTSPGSTHPATDIHDFTLYLPAEYGTVEGKQYPTLYLSHGGGGNAQDWEGQMYASHILDNLIAQGHIEPTVVVMPSFYNLQPNTSQTDLSRSANFVDIRENYVANLLPFVEATYNVSTEPSRRAFAGLSLGGVLTVEMFLNGTEHFDYFGIFSGATGSGSNTTQYLNAAKLAATPAIAEKGVFMSFGLYDVAFPDCRAFQEALDGLNIAHVSRVVPYGYHALNTWQDSLWHFGVTSLWKNATFSANTRGAQ